MQNRLSLADLKAKESTTVIPNAEIFTGGYNEYCHQGFMKPLPSNCHKK